MHKYQNAGFTVSRMPSETASHRLQWERHLLGQPITDHPLDVVAESAPIANTQRCALIDVAMSAGRPIVTRAVRLPGWTGGKGFFVGDQQTYVLAISAKGLPSPKPWQPLALRGRWRLDEWGGGWLQVDGIEELGEVAGIATGSIRISGHR